MSNIQGHTERPGYDRYPSVPVSAKHRQTKSLHSRGRPITHIDELQKNIIHTASPEDTEHKYSTQLPNSSKHGSKQKRCKNSSKRNRSVHFKLDENPNNAENHQSTATTTQQETPPPKHDDQKEIHRIPVLKRSRSEFQHRDDASNVENEIIGEDYTFKWKKETVTMSLCDHNHLLFVVSKVIDGINAQMKQNNHTETNLLLYNKFSILSYVHSHRLDGIKLLASKHKFVHHLKDIVFHTEKGNGFFTEILKQQYLDHLYQNIITFDLNSIHASSECHISFTPSFPHDEHLRKGGFAIISNLNQHQYIIMNDDKGLGNVMDALDECNNKITSILFKKWMQMMQTTDIWDHSIQSIKECSVYNMQYLLYCILMDERFNTDSKQKQKFIALQGCLPKILQCFEENGINGPTFTLMKQGQFVEKLAAFRIDADHIIATLQKHLSALYRALSEQNVFQITAFYIKTNLKWNNTIRSIKHCKEQEIIYILIHLLSDPSLINLMPFHNKIIEHFVRRKIKGSMFDHFKEQAFVDDLYKFLKFKHKQSVIKLYYAIKRCRIQDIAHIPLEYNDECYGKWDKRTNFKNTKRVGYRWNDGVIVVADIVAHSNEENQSKVQLLVKIVSSRPFWLTLPSDKLCKPTQEIIEESHHEVFDKWMRIIRIKNKQSSGFEDNVFREMVTVSEKHPQLLFTIRYSNYRVRLEDKTYDHVLQSLFATLLSVKCRKSRCHNKAKLDCHCDVNGFQKYTYCLLMAIIKENIQKNNAANHSESVLETLKTKSDNMHKLTEKMRRYLPAAMRKGKYMDNYIAYIEQWLLHDFYNIICSHCGSVNKSIMINRVFHYSSTLRNCRTCGVIIGSRNTIENDAVLSETHKTPSSINWFYTQHGKSLDAEGIDVSVVSKTLTDCKYNDKISAKHQEQDVLNLLRSFLNEQFDELTYYLSRFLSDLDEWKALRIKITADYYLYGERNATKSFIAVNRFMSNAGIHSNHRNIVQNCWIRALFQCTKDNAALMDILDDIYMDHHKGERKSNTKQDVLCIDFKRLQLFRTLTPYTSISACATRFIQKFQKRYPKCNMDVFGLIKRFLDFKIDHDNIPPIVINGWGYLKSPSSISYWKRDKRLHTECIVIKPKHESLKQELLEAMCTDNEQFYTALISKAKDIRTEQIQRVKAKKTLYGVIEGKPIALKHICAVLAFVEIPQLRDQIRRLFTKAFVYDIHRRFRNLFKLLKEAIDLYGGTLRSRKLLYYDIDKEIALDKYRASYNIPIICSTKPSAFNNNGNELMAECTVIKRLTYFDISWMYPHLKQDFYICFGGECSISSELHMDRQRLKKGSICKIFSPEHKDDTMSQRFTGQVVKVLTDDEGATDQLKIVYGHNSTCISRWSEQLSVKDFDKNEWRRNRQLFGDNEFLIHLLGSRVNIMNECDIPFDPQLLLRMKTVFRYYKKTQNVIPNFHTFIEETGIGRMIRSHDKRYIFRDKYSRERKNAQHRQMQTFTPISISKQDTSTERGLYDTGIFMRYDVSNPRFESLAEETMFNQIVNIPYERFNQHLAKAKEIHSENCLVLLSTATDSNFGIEEYEPISIAHIMSIIIHTEEPHYTREYTRSCLIHGNSHSEDTIVRNHCNNFYWFGRYLFECVEYFGTILEEQLSMKHNYGESSTKQGLRRIFEFGSFAPPINFPRSTTKSMSMALHYATETGSVLELIPKYNGVLNSTKYINLSTMSEDYDSDMRLFFGRRCVIQINNIWCNGHSLRDYILPLLYFEKIMLQTIFDRQFYNAKHLYDIKNYKEKKTSKIQTTLFNLLHSCVAMTVCKNEKTDLTVNLDKHTQTMIIQRYFPKIRRKDHNEILYVVDLLQYWCSQRTFITFEAFAAELPFMIKSLKCFFFKKLKTNDEYNVRIKNLCLIMPNLKHYRNFDKQVIVIRRKQKAAQTAPKSKGIINTMDDNLRLYYAAYKDPRYDDCGFRAWCDKKKHNDAYIKQQMQSFESCNEQIPKFDPHFPFSTFDSEDESDTKSTNDTEPSRNRSKDIWEILLNATKPNLFRILYDNLKPFLPNINVGEKQPDSKHYKPRRTTISAGRFMKNVSSAKQKYDDDEDAIHKILSNCQMHEMPDAICDILEKLEFHFDKKDTKPVRSTTKNKNALLSPETLYTPGNNKRYWKNKNRDKLKRFYSPISKLEKASKKELIEVAQEIKLFDQDTTDKLCEELMDRIFTDIERMKPWKCNRCWFRNRKMMIGGLWCLYNQLNECGLCGAERDNNESIKRYNSKSSNKNKIPHENKTFKLPPELKQWDHNDKQCSIDESKMCTSMVYLEDFNKQITIQFATKYLVDPTIGLKDYKTKIIQHFKDSNIDGYTLFQSFKDVVNGIHIKLEKPPKLKQKLVSLCKKIKKHIIVCNPMKRISVILSHYQSLTQKLNETNGRYPYSIRKFLSTSAGDYRLQLSADFDHIRHHQLLVRQNQPYIPRCTDDKCIHRNRIERYHHRGIKLSLGTKQQLFNCNDWKDHEYILYLDKIHCALFHDDGSLDDHKEKEIIKRYSKFAVYSAGVYMDHSVLSPLHVNLKQELINNSVYTMDEIVFNESVQKAHDKMIGRNCKNDMYKQWTAKASSETDGIKIGDPIQMEHILVMYLYTSKSELYRAFRESYRWNKDEHKNENTYVRSYHINNFYWMGRFICTAIQCFGEKPKEKDVFYHGLNKKFLFGEFSTIFEIPTSTTENRDIAGKYFAREDGIVLKLSPKFKNELNNNKYLNVTSISHYGSTEDERLFAGMTVLAVIDIIYWCGSKPRKLGGNAMVFLYLERIIEQTVHNKSYYNYGFPEKSDQKQRLLPLLTRQMKRNERKDSKSKPIAVNIDDKDNDNEYLYALFGHYCDSKQDYINLTCIYDHDEIEAMDESIKHIFFKQNKANDECEHINDDNLRLIFPKLKGYKNHLGYWKHFEL